MAVGGAGHFVAAAAALAIATAAAIIQLAGSTAVAVVVIAGAITIAAKAHDSGRRHGCEGSRILRHC